MQHAPALHPVLADYFAALRAGRGLAYVLIAMAVAALLGGVGYVLTQSRFEAWTLAAVLPSFLVGALALRVYNRTHNPLGTPEALAILRGTLVGFYVRETTMKAAGAQLGKIYGVVLELPGGKEAHMNPRSPEHRAALMHALALQCPHARSTPPR